MAGYTAPVNGKSKGINSVEVGFRLLECLEASEGPLPLKVLAQGVGMSPSKAHFYLSSYLRLGLVMQVNGKYDLGPAVLRLGLAAMARFDVIQRAREAMEAVRDATGEPVLLTIWGNLGPTIVHHLQGAHRSPLESRVGTVLPALSASGYAFLAYLPKDTARDIISAQLERPLVVALQGRYSVTRIMQELAKVRQHGVARIAGLYGQGYVAVAAPIFDHQGTVRMALTVLADKRHSDTKYGGKIVRTLLAQTGRVSSEMRGIQTRTSQPMKRRTETAERKVPTKQ